MIYSDWHFCYSLQMNPHETMEYLDVLFILQESSLCLRERMAALDKLASMDSLRQAYAVPVLVDLLFSVEARAAYEAEENEDIVNRFRLIAKQLLYGFLSGGEKDNMAQLRMIVGKLDSKNDDDVLAYLRGVSDRKLGEARDRFYLETQEHVPELILLELLCQLSREQADKVQEIVSGNLKRLFHSARNGSIGLLPQRIALEIDISCDTDSDKIEANFPEDWLSLPEFMEIFARSRLYASTERTPFEAIQDELTSLTIFQQWNWIGLDNSTPAWFVDSKHSKKVLCAVLWQSILWELAWEVDPERCLALANDCWGPPNYSVQQNRHSQSLPADVKVNWITQKVLDAFPAVYHDRKDPMRTIHQAVCTPWQFCAASGGIADTRPFQSVPAMRRNSCALRAFAASAMLRRIFTDYPSPCRDEETEKLRNYNILRLVLNLGFALESYGPREERTPSLASYTWSQALRGLGYYAHRCITALGVGGISRDLAACLSQDILKRGAKEPSNWQLKALYNYQGLLVCARWANKAQSLYTVSRTGVSGSPWEQKAGTLPFTCIEGICKSLSSKISGQLREDHSVLRLLCQNGYAFPETGTPPYWYDRCMDGLYEGDRITAYDLLQAPVPPPEVWTSVSPVLSQLRDQEKPWISADAWEVILTLRLQAVLETTGDRDPGEWLPWFSEWYEALSSGGSLHDNPVLFYALIRLLQCQPHVARNLDMDKNPLDMILDLIVQLVDVFTEGERAYFQYELGCSLAHASPAFGADRLHRACAGHLIALDRQADQLPYATDLQYYFLEQLLFWPPEKTEHVLTNVRGHLINYYQQQCANSQRNDYYVQNTNGGQRLDPLLDRYLHRRNGQLFVAHQRLEPRDAVNSLTSRITGKERRILGIVTDKHPCQNGSQYQLRLGEITKTVNSVADFKLGDLAVLDQTANPPRLFTPIWQWKDGSDVLRVQVSQLSVSRISLRDSGTHAPMRDYLRDFLWDTLRRQTENQRGPVNLADKVNEKMEESLSEALDLWTPDTFAYENGVYSLPLPRTSCEVVYNEGLKSYVPVERSLFRLLLDRFYGKAAASVRLYYISWQSTNGVRSALFSVEPGFNYRLSEEDWTEDSFTVLSKELFHSNQNYGTAVTVRLTEKDGFPLLALADNAFDFHNRDWARLFRVNEAFCAEKEGSAYWVTKALSAPPETDDDEEELPDHGSLSTVKIRVIGRFGMGPRENCGLADNGWNRLRQRKKSVQAVQYRNYTFSEACAKDAALIRKLTGLRPGDVFELENYKAFDDRYPGYCWTRMKGTWISLLCALESITLADGEPIAPGLLADRKCVVENIFPPSFRKEISRIEMADLIPDDKLPESLRELPEDVRELWGVVVTMPGQSRDLRETDNLNFKVGVCPDGNTVEILDLPGSAFGRKPRNLGCKVFFRRGENGWRATAFQQTVYVRALWRVDIHDASVPLIQNGYSLGTTRIGRDYHLYYVMQDLGQPVLHAWPERFAPEEGRELSGTRSGYVQLKDVRHSDWEIFQYAKSTKIALLVGSNGGRRWGEVLADYFQKEGSGRASVRIYEVNGLREYFQEALRKSGKDGSLKQMPFYDVRTVFESRKQEEQPAKEQKIRDNIAWYKQWYQGMERHLQGTLYIPASEGKGRMSASRPEDAEAFQLSDCQLPAQVHPDAAGEWLSRIPFRKSDERQLWVRHKYPNGSRARARMVEEDGHWAASCLTAEPFELGEDLAAEFQANPDELIDQENLYLSFAGVEQDEYLRFEWGYGYTFLAARSCIVDMDFHPNDAELFFGDRIQKFYISYWAKEGKWVLRLPPDAIKHRIVYYLWRDAGLGIVQMLRVQIDLEKNKINLLEVSRAEYRVGVSGTLTSNAWFFDDLYFGQLDPQSRARLLEETREEYPDKPVVERQIFVLLDRSAGADRKRPPQFQYISLKRPGDLDLIAGKIVCLAAGDIEMNARKNRAKQSNDYRLKFYLDTELPNNEDGNGSQASMVVNVNRRKFSLDESKLRVLYAQQKEAAFHGSRMLVRLEKTEYRHFHDGRVEWSGFVRGICIREQSSLREWVSSKRDCLVTLGNIPSEHLVNSDGWMIQVEVAPGITSEISFQDVEGTDYKNGATALLEMVDDTLKAYVVLPSDEDYIPQKGRVAELLIMDGAANSYHAVPDRTVLEPEGDSEKHFTVAGFPQLVFRNQKLLEQLICRPWPRLAIVSKDGDLSSEELTRDGGAARIECGGPCETPRLCFLGTPDGTERTVEKQWSQVSYMDAASSAIYQSLREGTWHYHDRTYGVYDSALDRLNIHRLPSGEDSSKFLVFPNPSGNLRVPQSHFSDMGFPIRELAENGIPDKEHTYAVAGADERSIWIEAFPGRLLEAPKRFLFVSGCITNLKKFPNNVFAPGDMLTLKEEESFKGGLRTLTVTEFHYGLRASLEWDKTSPKWGGRPHPPVRCAVLPVREVLEDGVVLGSPQWSLTYPLPASEASAYQEGGTAVLDSWNRLSPGGQLHSGDVGMLYFDPKTRKLALHGHPELSAKPSRESSDWENANWLGKLLSESDPYVQRKLFEAIGENEMLPVVCKRITTYKEAWLARVQKENFPEDSVLYGICLGQLEDERCLEAAGLSTPVVLVRAGKFLLHLDRQQLLPGLSAEQYVGVVRALYGRGIWLHRKDGAWHCGTEDPPLEADCSQVEIQLLDKVPEARGFLALSCQSMELLWLPYENVGLMGDRLGTDRTTETVWKALEASNHFANQMKLSSPAGSNIRRARLLGNRSVSLVNVNRTKHDSEIFAVGTKLRVTPLVQLEQPEKQVMFKYLAEVYPQGELILLYAENENEVRLGRPIAVEVSKRSQSVVHVVLDGMRRERQALTSELHQAYANSHDACGIYSETPDVWKLLHLDRQNAYLQCSRQAAEDAGKRKAVNSSYCGKQYTLYGSGAPLVYLYSYLTAFSSPIAYLYIQKNNPPADDWYEKNWWWHVHSYLKHWMERDGRLLLLYFCGHPLDEPIVTRSAIDAVPAITAALLLHQLWIKGEKEGDTLYSDAGKLSVHTLRMMGLAGEGSVQQEVLLKYWFAQERSSGLWTRLNHITIGGERTCGPDQRENPREDGYNGTLSSVQLYRLVTQCEHILHLDMDAVGENIDIQRRISVAQSLLYSVGRLRNFDAYEQVLENLSEGDTPLITWTLAKLGRTLTPRSVDEIAADHLSEPVVKILRGLWKDCLRDRWMPQLLLNYPVPLKSTDEIDSRFEKCFKRFRSESKII